MPITIKDLKAGDEFHYDLFPKYQEKVNTTLVRILAVRERSLSVEIVGPIWGNICGFGIGQKLSLGISNRCFVRSPSNFCFRFGDTDTLTPDDPKF